MAAAPILVSVSGIDRPGLAAGLFAELRAAGTEILDVEQVQIQGRLLLGILVQAGAGPSGADLERQLIGWGRGAGVSVEVEPAEAPRPRWTPEHHHVTVLGREVGAEVLAGVFTALAGAEANVDRILRLSRQPVYSYELTVSGGDPTELRQRLAAAAARLQVDIAVERSGLHRRAKRLVVMDVDSTLIQGEVIELLAARTGHGEEVARITAAAMRGELDFEAALRARVALLGGLPESVLDEVRQGLVLTPGARTLVRTLRRLGYATAIVSGGFSQIIDHLAADLGVDRAAANTLEITGGRLTGALIGPVVDRAGKAEALRRFAGEAGLSLAQTVAVGDGANDVDMLGAAGLGIAFNAKAVARAAADTSINVPYLDAILHLLGISREEIEAADSGDAADSAGPA
jgi:phosphoserine phosphatase